MIVGPRPKPMVTKGSVIVKVKGAGINPVDFKIREGYIKDWPQTLPIITGWDVAGIIEEVGEDVTDYAVGDEVYSYNRPAFDDPSHAKEESRIGVDGCAAEYVKVSAWKLAKKPKCMSFAEAAAVPLAGLTAYQGIFEKGGLTEGKTLLVLNASGGVGSYAVQYAASKGIKVVGTCSGRNVDFVKGLGAEAVDYTLKNVVEDVKKVPGFENGVDVVFDCIGGDDTASGIELLKETGTIVCINNWGVADAAKAKGKTGVAFLVSVSGKTLSEITELIEAGKVKTAHLTEFPLAQAKEAFEKVETHRVRGKVVLTN